MTKEEYKALLAELEVARVAHREQFKRWYEFANFPTIEDYCEVGWLIDRVLGPSDSEG